MANVPGRVASVKVLEAMDGMALQKPRPEPT
jgi:hypothetical protein